MAHDGGGVGVGEGDHRGLHPRIVVGQGTKQYRVQRWKHFAYCISFSTWMYSVKPLGIYSQPKKLASCTLE